MTSATVCMCTESYVAALDCENSLFLLRKSPQVARLGPDDVPGATPTLFMAATARLMPAAVKASTPPERIGTNSPVTIQNQGSAQCRPHINSATLYS